MSKKDFIVAALQPAGNINTEATVGVHSPPVSTSSPEMSRETLDIDETLGNRFPGASEYGGRIFEGDTAGAARPNSFPFFLSMIFGEPVTTIVQPASAGPPATPAVYKHVWKPASAGARPLPASLWVARNDPAVAIVDKYVGAKGANLNLSVEANGYLLFTVGMAIKKIIENVAAPSVARDTTRKWSFTKVALQMAVGPTRNVDTNLTSLAATSFGFSYGNGLTTDLYQIGSNEVVDIPEGNVEPEVTFTAAKDIHLHYRRALLDTPEDVRLKLVATGPIITGTHAFQLSLDLKRLEYVAAPAPLDASDTLRSVPVTARPIMDDTFGDMLELSIINDQDGTTYRPPA